MKIGILTYHRSHNYGAILQAVATRVALQEMGHNVYYVDYYPTYHRRMYKMFSWYSLFKYRNPWKMYKYIKRCLTEYPYRKERSLKFNSFINTHIAPYCKPVTDKYDIVIYGSDQIWRKQIDTGSFNPIYFGRGLKADKHVSFAASMGNMELTLSEKKYLKELVSNLDSVSVREKNLQEALLNIGCVGVVQVLDPTLLVSASEWDKIIPPRMQHSTHYVLIYDLMQGSINRELVIAFAKEKNLEVIEIVGTATQASTEKLRTTDGPTEFIDYIRNADYIFTSSFHGLVFSINYNKQFFASFSSNASRAISILDSLGLRERLLLPNFSTIPALPSIDYNLVSSKLNVLQKVSFDFLKDNCNAK